MDRKMDRRNFLVAGLAFPMLRTDARMARGYEHLQTQHTIWHLGQHGVFKPEATRLLAGLSFAEVDDVHDCMHSSGAVVRQCVAVLRGSISARNQKKFQRLMVPYHSPAAPGTWISSAVGDYSDAWVRIDGDGDGVSSPVKCFCIRVRVK